MWRPDQRHLKASCWNGLCHHSLEVLFALLHTKISGIMTQRFFIHLKVVMLIDHYACFSCLSNLQWLLCLSFRISVCSSMRANNSHELRWSWLIWKRTLGTICLWRVSPLWVGAGATRWKRQNEHWPQVISMPFWRSSFLDPKTKSCMKNTVCLFLTFSSLWNAISDQWMFSHWAHIQNEAKRHIILEGTTSKFLSRLTTKTKTNFVLNRRSAHQRRSTIESNLSIFSECLKQHFLFLQHLSTQKLQGPLKSYRVRYFDSEKVETFIVDGSVSNLTLFDLDQRREYGVFVDVSTSMGFNESAQFQSIAIPKQSLGTPTIVLCSVLGWLEYFFQM